MPKFLAGVGYTAPAARAKGGSGLAGLTVKPLWNSPANSLKTASSLWQLSEKLAFASGEPCLRGMLTYWQAAN